MLGQGGHEGGGFDRTPDVGGVWSGTRRYPGLCTQSVRDTYALSDFPMPRDYPEWPSGEQVQRYLAAYAAEFGVDRVLRLETEVTAAVPAADGGWTVSSRGPADGTTATERFDRLVVANGVFCEPAVPEFAGLDEFTAAGGQLLPATSFHDAEQARDKHALVVGYGKTACDVAVPMSATAASTAVIARQVLWKVPRRIAGRVNFKMLLLTRMGEALFRYAHLRGFEKFLHGPGNGLRRGMLNSLGPISVRQFRLDELGLVPRGAMEDIVRNAIGLATEGFFEGVADGRIAVHRDRTISRLLARDGRPHAELSDGTVLPADLVVCATGFRQGVPFLGAELERRLLDERGNFALYRQILPVDVPDLYFAGYNSSFFSPLNAEMAAVWIAAHLGGLVDLPDREALRRAVTDQLAFMDAATNGHHSRGTKIIPFSMHNVDEVLGDLGLNIPARVRAAHWLAPIQPSAYGKVTAKLVARLPPVGGSADGVPIVAADDGAGGGDPEPARTA